MTEKDSEILTNLYKISQQASERLDFHSEFSSSRAWIYKYGLYCGQVFWTFLSPMKSVGESMRCAQIIEVFVSGLKDVLSCAATKKCHLSRSNGFLWHWKINTILIKSKNVL